MLCRWPGSPPRFLKSRPKWQPLDFALGSLAQYNLKNSLFTCGSRRAQLPKSFSITQSRGTLGRKNGNHKAKSIRGPPGGGRVCEDGGGRAGVLKEVGGPGMESRSPDVLSLAFVPPRLLGCGGVAAVVGGCLHEVATGHRRVETRSRASRRARRFGRPAWRGWRFCGPAR